MKYLFVAIIAALAITTFALSEEEAQVEFAKWMQKYQKSYTNDEFHTRFNIFKNNAEFIIAENAKDLSYRVAMNEFGDLTNEEFVSIYNGFAGERVTLNRPLSPVVVSTVGLPAHVDWRTKGAVTGVKNQGQCGSCWAFSTTGSTEGQHFLSGQGSLVGLSEQNLVDCSGSYGNMGCDGGLMDDAFQYIIANNGIDTEASYPYTATDGTCHYSVANRGATLKSYHDIPSGSEADLTSDIASVGPISVAIDASHSSFQFYSGGVYYEPACSSTQLDHGVLAVGYGDTGATNGKYYIVKNSWGTSWGMSGYIWMSRDRNNNCGIATAASYPTA